MEGQTQTSLLLCLLNCELENNWLTLRRISLFLLLNEDKKCLGFSVELFLLNVYVIILNYFSVNVCTDAHSLTSSIMY